MKKIYAMCLAALMMIPAGKANAITVDDLVGSYVETSQGQHYWNWNNFFDFYSSNPVKIEKVDETTVKLVNLNDCKNNTNLYLDYLTDLVGTVDFEARTITFQPQQIDGYYYFCGFSYDWDGENGGSYLYDKPVIATFNEDASNITLSAWAIIEADTYYEPGDANYWNSCYVYSYTYDYDNDYDNKDDYYLSGTTLRKYEWSADAKFEAGELGSGDAAIYAFNDGTYLLSNIVDNSQYKANNEYLYMNSRQWLEVKPGEGGALDVVSGSGYFDYYDGYYDLYYLFTNDSTYQYQDYDWDTNEYVTDENGDPVMVDYTTYKVREDWLLIGFGEDGSKFDLENKEISFNYYYYSYWGNADEDYSGTYTFTWGETTEGISSVKAAESSEAPVYSLSGVKVANSKNGLPKGLYISNGKKFVVR